MIQKPNIPKGTRDFGHAQMNKRNYIFSTIRSVFSLYGYNQIETPAMELMSSLMGKYGEEGDKLLFRIQNSGEKADKAPEKGLRYDLTVPFARYVVQHKDELQFPFRRYQIQPVWRADRPQKGRYREFYQCDADIIGTSSLLCEVELIQMMEEVYKRFGIRVSLHLNNRKILYGIAEVIGAPDKMTDITTAIDKIDKIGIENVNKELSERGLSEESISLLQPILHLQGSNEDKLNQIAEVLCQSKTGLEGIRETRSILDMYNQSGKGPQDDKQMFSIELDLTLARGLNYYTGAIFEVKALDASIGSITGGGRYDNLTGIFGLPNVSGVGISFGADRIYDVLDELNLYPEETSESVQLMFISMGEAELIYSSQWAQSLRKQGIKTEIYPEAAKMKKMLGYANNRGINRVAIVGGNEMEQNKVLYKDMQSGEQRTVDIEELVKLLK